MDEETGSNFSGFIEELLSEITPPVDIKIGNSNEIYP